MAGSGFHPHPLVPKHLVLLTDGEVRVLADGLPEGDLRRMLRELPLLTEDDGTLTPRGEQAIERMVAGSRNNGTLDFLRPGTTPEQQEELKAALREHHLAEALLEVSVREGKPGEERSAIVARWTASQERLRVAALEFGKAAMRGAE